MPEPALVNKKLKHDMERVFAILPRERVAPAVAATLARLRESQAGAGPSLKWAEFDMKGRFRRGGRVALHAHVAQVLSRPQDDADVALMAREAADGAAQPGRVLREAGGERFILFLPTTAADRNGPSRLCVRGYMIDQAVFSALQIFFNPGSGVTEAERRVMFQLVSGASLREAAERDRVSVETKRVQIKSSAGKLQCSGQMDLIRLLMGQLAYVAAIAEDEAGEARYAEDFILRTMGGGIDLKLERLGDGRLQRCLEIGPADGRPVVVLHGMMFGMMLSGAAPALAEAKLRLIIPLRRGYLDPRPVLGLHGEGRLAEESIADVCDLIARRGLGPVTILGHSLGSVLALRLARQRPELLTRLVLLSVNTLRSGEGDATGELYGGYRTLAAMSRAITLEFSYHYRNQEAAQSILHGMFGGSRADVEALEGRGAAAPVHTWFPELYAGSVAGIADDYTLAMAPFVTADVPALFVHGADDPLSPLASVQAIAKTSPMSQLHVIEGAGHFAVASHSTEVWSAIAGFVSR